MTIFEVIIPTLLFVGLVAIRYSGGEDVRDCLVAGAPGNDFRLICGSNKSFVHRPRVKRFVGLGTSKLSERCGRIQLKKNVD